MVYKRIKRGIYKRSGRRLRSSMPMDVAVRAGRLMPRAKKPRFQGAKKAIINRARTAARVYRRRRANQEVGSYQQFTTENKTTGKTISIPRMNYKLMNAAREYYLYSFKGVKSFDDNGYYYASNTLGSDNWAYMPVYAILLNGRNVTGGLQATPFRRLRSGTAAAGTNGRLQWVDQAGIAPTSGSGGNIYLNTEYQPTRGVSAGGYNPEPGEKVYWNWSELKLNLWGAKAKAIKWNIMICSVSEDDVSPWHNDSATDLPVDSQQTWEEMIKQYTFNPISKLNYQKTNRIKVLKSYERVIQPTSSIENDADPHVHVLKWFSRWNRVVKYDRLVQKENEAGTQLVTLDANNYQSTAEPTQDRQEPYSCYPNEREQIFVLVRASDYSQHTVAGTTNSVSGSFDFSMRSKFTVLE